MVFILAPYFVLAILLVLFFLQTIDLRIAKKLVSRLLIDDIYYYESRSNLLSSSLDKAIEEQEKSVKRVSLKNSKSFHRDAWKVANGTDRTLPMQRKPRAKLNQDKVSFSEVQNNWIAPERNFSGA
jgi:hypothetical protein